MSFHYCSHFDDFKYEISWVCLFFLRGLKNKHCFNTMWSCQDMSGAVSQVSRSVVSNSLQPHGLQHTRPPLSSSQSPPKPLSIESVMPSSHLLLCHPLLLPPSVFPSIRVFSSSLHQVAKVLEFQLQHQSFQ